MKFIALTKGAIALVDDEDFESLMRNSWHLQSTGYAARGGGNRPYVLMHRQITKAPDDRDVDHANGDPLDNRRGNLRPCTAGQNQYNRRKSKNRKYKGVFVRAGHKSFYAEIMTHGVRHHLGAFATDEMAARAYDAAAKAHHGSFARLNFPDEQAVA